MMRLLSELAVGESSKIIDIKGGWGIKHKLLLEGVKKDSIIRVISSCCGPIVAEVDRNTVTIGKGMAQRIVVEG